MSHHFMNASPKNTGGSKNAEAGTSKTATYELGVEEQKLCISILQAVQRSNVPHDPDMILGHVTQFVQAIKS